MNAQFFKYTETINFKIKKGLFSITVSITLLLDLKHFIYVVLIKRLLTEMYAFALVSFRKSWRLLSLLYSAVSFLDHIGGTNSLYCRCL